jgi:hypothetical protein
MRDLLGMLFKAKRGRKENLAIDDRLGAARASECRTGNEQAMNEPTRAPPPT